MLIGDNVIARTMFAIKRPEWNKEMEGAVRVNGHIHGYVSGTIDAKVDGVIHGEVRAMVRTEGKEATGKEEPLEETKEKEGKVE